MKQERKIRVFDVLISQLRRQAIGSVLKRGGILGSTKRKVTGMGRDQS